MPAGKLKTARFKFPFDFRRGPGPCLRASFSAVLPGQHRLQQELQFDGYRLSLSYLFVVSVIGLLIYLGFAFFQCHLREKTAGILFDNIVFYFLIGIGVCILLLFKTAYHALKFSIHHKANRKNCLLYTSGSTDRIISCVLYTSDRLTAQRSTSPSSPR